MGSIGYSEPINSVNVNSERVSNGDMSRETSVTSSDRSSRSPSKDVRAISPEKHIIPTGLSPAKSEQQIASSFEKKRESRSMDNLNTAIEIRAREEERKREEERRNNEENERRMKDGEKRKKGGSSKKENRRKSGEKVASETAERRVHQNQLKILKSKTKEGGTAREVDEGVKRNLAEDQ